MTAVDEIILRSAYDECGAFDSGLSGTLFRGWILAPFPIRAICFRWADGATAAAVCGTPRPDVAAQFPTEPQAQHTGFWSVHPNFKNAARATVAISDVSGRWWEWSAPLGLGEMRAIRAREAGADSAAQWEAWHTAGLPSLERYVVGKWRTTLDEHRPLTVRLDIINKCNLRCVMCHYSDDAVFKRPAKRVSLDDFERWFATVHSGVREVVLSCGDEPLMSPQFSEIVRSITSRYPEVNVMFSTNAMLMDERIARTIVDSGVALVMMSIDGVLPETLEAVRKGSRFDRVIGNARQLSELKRRVGSLRPYLVYNFVMMNRNLAEAPAFVEMAHALGAHYVDFRLVVTSEYFFDGAELCEDRPGRFNFFRRLTLEAAQRVGLAIYMPPAFPVPEEPEVVPSTDELLTPFRALVGGLPPNATDLAGLQARPVMREYGARMGDLPAVYCERPFSEIMIRNQDEVLPCAWHKNVLGNLSTGATVGEIFFGPAFEAVRANMLRPDGDPGCVGCPIKSSHLPTTRHG
jgi:MoaA/NifB/PqqE/SkfB family radical SAM enzyme